MLYTRCLDNKWYLNIATIEKMLMPVLENFALDLMQIYLYFIFGLQFIEFPVNGKKIL
jgi:hypothetical protein